MVPTWLAERWQTLFPALEALGTDQESEIERLCAEEKAAWRARLEITTNLRNLMAATRNEIKKLLEVTDSNSCINLRTMEYEHVALKYMTFSEEEWQEMNAISQKRLRVRMQD